MRINHNAAGLAAYNRGQFNSKAVGIAAQRLSSGLRINTAADDVGGLGISEKMRGQIRGLEQAQRNIQDGISMIQTAENGLAQILNPNLQRLRELAVQAANGTLSSADRQAIQLEVNQVLASIDDIANNTEFNSQKVLRPSVDRTPPNPNGKVDIVFVVDNSGSMASIQTSVAQNISSFIDSISGRGVTDIRMGVLEYTDSDFLKSNFGGNWTSDKDVVSSELIRMAATNRGGTEDAMHALNIVADQYDFRENEDGLQAKHIIFLTNEDADDDYLAASTLANLQSKGIQVHGVYNKQDPDIGEFDAITGATNGKSVDLASPSWGLELSTVIGRAIGLSGSGSEGDTMPTLHFQTGANTGDEFTLELFDARTRKLGLADLSVETAAKANEAIGKIDAAMTEVSSHRSRYGVYQNALEHMNNNVSNYSINLAATESRIRDVDVSKEAAMLTNKKLLLESSNAMIAKANEMLQAGIEFLK
ncbi:flagellin [Paenibacillus sp. S-38]|uniref:flagellin N-terminal helical domain-containing protein n=1 Tax=Paenibacillus sp. S-38 TaxID=3416710 RepID=UPI003CE971FC